MTPSEKKRDETTIPTLTAADVKNATGMSYRQLNDWGSKGALPNRREQEAGWRKFTSRELFVLMVCSEIRKRFGVPVEKIAWLKDSMLGEKTDYLQLALRLMKHGLAVFIVTDFETTCYMEPDWELLRLFENGEFRTEDPQAFVFLSVNPLVNMLLTKGLKIPVPALPIKESTYRKLHQNESAARAHNTAELEVLLALRREAVKALHIIPREKEIQLETEQELQGNANINTVVNGNDFQTVTIKRHRGRNRILRNVPKKLIKEPYQLVVVLDD